MTEPVKPVVAATVILARRGDSVGSLWQCFMVRRTVLSDFAADVFVFPGGKVDEIDRTPMSGEYVSECPHLVPPEEKIPWQALRIAAIRELFEEAGVLMARRRETPIRLEGAEGDRFAVYRRQLQSGALSMLKLAAQERLIYPLDSLHAISRWITPESFSRRFDTHFFVALMPEGQQPVHDERETTDGVWIAPGDALARYREGDFPLVFATEKHLELLARYPSVEGLIASTEDANPLPVAPRRVEENGTTRFLLPGDEGY